jgi:hypothetical protein
LGTTKKIYPNCAVAGGPAPWGSNKKSFGSAKIKSRGLYAPVQRRGAHLVKSGSEKHRKRKKKGAQQQQQQQQKQRKS